MVATRPRGDAARRHDGREGRVLIRRLIFIAFFLEVGLLLLVLPWSGFWDRNYFAIRWPVIRVFVTNDFVRGAVTGLGVVNIVAGLSDLLGLVVVREERRPPVGDRQPLP